MKDIDNSSFLEQPFRDNYFMILSCRPDVNFLLGCFFGQTLAFIDNLKYCAKIIKLYRKFLFGHGFTQKIA